MLTIEIWKKNSETPWIVIKYDFYDFFGRIYKINNLCVHHIVTISFIQIVDIFECFNLGQVVQYLLCF